MLILYYKPQTFKMKLNAIYERVRDGYLNVTPSTEKQNDGVEFMYVKSANPSVVVKFLYSEVVIDGQFNLNRDMSDQEFEKMVVVIESHKYQDFFTMRIPVDTWIIQLDAMAENIKKREAEKTAP